MDHRHAVRPALILLYCLILVACAAPPVAPAPTNLPAITALAPPTATQEVVPTRSPTLTAPASPLPSPSETPVVSVDSLWAIQVEGAILHDVLPASDGGFLLAGQADGDAWVAKLSASGGLEWQWIYGGGEQDTVYAVRATPDANYLVAGGARSFDLSAADEIDRLDAWVLKLNAQGEVLWQKRYGGFAFAGSAVGRISGQIIGYVVRADANGDRVWKRSLGRGACYALLEEPEGGLSAVCGEEETKVLRLDAAGNALAEQAFELDLPVLGPWYAGGWAELPMVNWAQLGHDRAGGYWLRAGDYLLRLNAQAHLPQCALQKRRPARPAVVDDLFLEAFSEQPAEPLEFQIRSADTYARRQPGPASLQYRCVSPPAP